MKKISSAFLLSSFALTLSGCDSLRNTFGLDHYQADEYAVPINPPLVLPPGYNLTPPQPGAAPTYAKTSDAQAQHTLQTSDAKVYTSSKTESTLVKNAPNANTVNIRELVDKEASESKMEGHIKTWSAQAKDNFASIQNSHIHKDAAENANEHQPKIQDE